MAQQMHFLLISALESPGLAVISSGLLWGTQVCGISSYGDLYFPLRSSQCLTELLGGLEDEAALAYADPACMSCASTLSSASFVSVLSSCTEDQTLECFQSLSLSQCSAPTS